MKLSDGHPTWRSALEFFFKHYLPRHLGVSPRTQESYGTAMRLLVERIDVRVHGPHELEAQTVFAFLEALERDRGNTASSRNLRLAALRCFWKAMTLWDADHVGRYDQLLRIPFKRSTRKGPDYFEPGELKRLFQTVDVSTHMGFRDLAILRYFYNTGSRISEVAEARSNWLVLTGEPQVTIRGKGGKWRVCPLWPTTAELLRVYLQQERQVPRKGFEEFLFITRLGKSFSRVGLWKLICGYFERVSATLGSLRLKRLTPHSLRHSTAVHLLRAGVEINVIKAWLGHADVSTTSGYLDLDLDKKREALERFLKLDMERITGGVDSPNVPLPENLVAWLERL
jgi:site-specific recombinase XerD